MPVRRPGIVGLPPCANGFQRWRARPAITLAVWKWAPGSKQGHKRIAMNQRHGDKSESLHDARFAALLRDLDESRRRGEDVSRILADLTPAEVNELHEARLCLDLLDQISPEHPREDRSEGRVGSEGRGDDTARTFRTQGEEACPDAAVVSDARGPSSLVGRQLGRYVIQEHIGSGGFGDVFRATDTRLGRQVALKILKPEAFANSQSRERFTREAQTAGILGHPAIVPVFDSFTHEGYCGIAFALCEGQTLDRWLSERNDVVDSRSAARVIATLADAVQHAHSRNVIHRDLKPGNIILVGRGGEERKDLDPATLRITDFGLAVAVDEPDRISLSGMPVGTPSYMSPEQARGDRNVSASTDVYALGAILYRLVTGHLPHERDNPFAIMQAILHDEVISPAKRNPDLPRDLAAICLKCLDKAPERRYPTCHDLADDLQRFLDGKPTAAREVSAWGKVVRWSRRNPWIAGTSAALVSLLLASSILFLTLWMQMASAWQEAEFQERRAEQRAQQAIQQTHHLQEAVHELLVAVANEPSIQSVNMEHFRERLLGSAGRFYEKLRSDLPKDERLIREMLVTFRELATLQGQLGDNEAAVQSCRHALAILDSAPERAAANMDLAVSLNQLLALNLRRMGALTESHQVQQATIEQARAYATAHPDHHAALELLASQLNQAAKGYLEIKDFRNAASSSGQAWELGKLLWGEDVPAWPATTLSYKVLETRADLLNRTGDIENGVQLAQQALTQCEHLWGEDREPDSSALETSGRLHFIVGVGLSSAGHHLPARQEFEDSLVAAAMLKDRHPHVVPYHRQRLAYWHSLALEMYFLGAFNEAEQKFRDLVTESELMAARFPQDAKKFLFYKVKSLSVLRAILQESDRWEEAQSCIEDAVETCRALVTEDETDFEVLSTLGNLHNGAGKLHLAQGDSAKAFQAYEDAFQVLEPLAIRQPHGHSVERLATAAIGMVTAADQQGDYPVALERAEWILENVDPAHRYAIVVRQSMPAWMVATRDVEEGLDRLAELEAELVAGQPGPLCNWFNLARAAARCWTALDGMEIPSSSTNAMSSDQRAIQELIVTFLDRAVDLDKPPVQAKQILAEPDFEAVRDNDWFPREWND